MISRNLVLLFLLSAPALATAQPDLSELDFAAGKALFDRNWVPAPASATSADGLGPHYTARSCAACHPKGGRGLAPAGFSVHLDDPVYGRRLQPFSVSPTPREAEIDWTFTADPTQPAWSGTFSGTTAAASLGPISIRQAPALFGLGLLEAVPLAALEALADPHDANADGIRGRLAWLPNGELGRFGWKAAAASLSEQAALALSLDLGLSSRLQPEAWGDCSATQIECRAQAQATLDTSQPLEVGAVAFDLLLTYLQRLPPAAAGTPQTAAAVLFARIGCASCHVPELPSTLGPVRAYTDLLLHDLGPELDDGLAEGAARSAEWRTAPLWSLPAAGPYLHDGRARTLDQAVAWHGGEAAASRGAWQSLSAAQRRLLSEFLLGL